MSVEGWLPPAAVSLSCVSLIPDRVTDRDPLAKCTIMIKANLDLELLVETRRLEGIGQFESLPVGLLCSAGVLGNEKSTGDGGGAGVSLIS